MYTMERKKKIILIVVPIAVVALALLTILLLLPTDKLCTVVFNSRGGNEISSVEVKTGSRLKLPSPPRKAGYIFDGWFYDEECEVAFDEQANIENNTTLYAKWRARSYIVSFSDGRKNEVVTFGEPFELPVPQAQGGQVFAGWRYFDENITDEYGRGRTKWNISHDISVSPLMYEVIAFDERDGKLVASKGADIDKLSDITIPDEIDGTMVTAVAQNGFSGCDNIKEIRLGKNITELGNFAFANCSNLSVVTLDGVTKLGISAFEGCVSLGEITVPNSVTTMGERCFYGCTALKSAELTCKSVGGYAFANCTSLAEVVVLQGTEMLGDHCFDGCVELTAVTLPSSLTNVGAYLFAHASSLAEITLPTDLDTVSMGMFSCCTSLRKVDMGNVKYIESYAFEDCTSLDLVIKNTVVLIGNAAFKHWTDTQTILFEGFSNAPDDWGDWQADCNAKIEFVP